MFFLRCHTEIYRRQQGENISLYVCHQKLETVGEYGEYDGEYRHACACQGTHLTDDKYHTHKT